MANAFLILDTATNALTTVPTTTWKGMGPGALAINGNAVYIANQMTASMTVVDLAGNLSKTFAVDPRPVGLAVNPAATSCRFLPKARARWTSWTSQVMPL
jgi:DNA-binding beta-propeller fold protein YncE